MKLKLTDKERVVLGFDDPAFIQELRAEDATLLDVIPKCNGKHDLTEEEIEDVRAEVENAATFGADPFHTKTVKGLRRKLQMG